MMRTPTPPLLHPLPRREIGESLFFRSTEEQWSLYLPPRGQDLDCILTARPPEDLENAGETISCHASARVFSMNERVLKWVLTFGVSSWHAVAKSYVIPGKSVLRITSSVWSTAEHLGGGVGSGFGAGAWAVRVARTSKAVPRKSFMVRN